MAPQHKRIVRTIVDMSSQVRPLIRGVPVRIEDSYVLAVIVSGRSDDPHLTLRRLYNVPEPDGTLSTILVEHPIPDTLAELFALLAKWSRYE